mgnify:CR=1 FL=1
MYEVGKREPDFETLEAIADFFNVDMNFLLGKQKSEPQKFSAKDERDIKKSLDELMESLDNKDGAPSMFDGQEIPQETKELLRNQIDIALHTVKLINKEKYNPHKNKG